MRDENGRELIKISALARLSGVPVPTIKHYMREGLLPPPALRTSRNMAWYDPRLAPRIRAVKDLQQTRFLPLRVIRDLLDGVDLEPDDIDVHDLLEGVLASRSGCATRRRAELIDEHLSAEELDDLARRGLATPAGEGDEATYAGDDLELVEAVRAARAAGLRRDMVPHATVVGFVEAVRPLVRFELEVFRRSVLPRAGDDLPRLAEAAVTASERLVALIRRKLLVPTLRELTEQAAEAPERR